MKKQQPAPRLSILASAVLAAGTSTAVHAQNRGAIEELVVTASARPIEPAKVGSAVSVITLDDLEVQGIQYASDALRHVPGVAVSRTGSFGGLTQVRVRGAEGNHVLVMIDGVDAAQGGGGEFDFASLLGSGIERIEVLRGPQSGLYGSNAMAGVINVITAGGADGTAIDLSAEGGDFDTRQLSFSARGGSDDLHGGFTVAHRESYFDTSPTGVEDDGDENTSILGRGAIVVSDVLTLDGAIRATERHTDYDAQDFSGGPQQGTTVDAPNYSDTNDAHLSAGATWNAGDGRWITRLTGNVYDGDSESVSVSGGFTSRFGSEQGREQLNFSTSVELGNGGDAAHFLTGFVQHENETYRNLYPSAPSQIPELDRGLLGVGMEYRGEYSERVYFSGVVRADDNDGFEDHTTYRATIAWLLNDNGTRLHSSYGSGVTNPTFFEQFGFIPGTFVGNPDVLPEKVDGWDIGIEQSFADDRLLFDVTYFDADLEDEIATIAQRPVNQPGISKRSGVELTLSGQVTEQLHLSSSFTYTDAQDPDGTEEVRRPPRMANVDLVYRFEGGARIYGGVIYNGEQLDNDFRNGFPAVKSPLEAYTLVNIGGSFSVGDRVEVFARVDNALDEEYQDVIGYATPGRAAYAGFRWRVAGER